MSPSSGPHYLPSAACMELKARRLFYPSAGPDTEGPLTAFLPWIDEFWFVDVADMRGRWLWTSAELVSSVSETFRGRTRRDEPFEGVVRREQYRVRERETLVTLCHCTGRGYDMFKSAFVIPKKSISVFLHRGDSQGEGGSNFYWLGRKRVREVLDCLEPGGLVVSDGSNAINQLRAFHRTKFVGSEAMAMATPFERNGRLWECVGHLDSSRNGPTLVWKPTRLSSDTAKTS